jgi:hypothetical protein
VHRVSGAFTRKSEVSQKIVDYYLELNLFFGINDDLPELA